MINTAEKLTKKIKKILEKDIVIGDNFSLYTNEDDSFVEIGDNVIAVCGEKNVFYLKIVKVE